MNLKHSLVTKLTLLTSISLLIIWLISVFAATYVSLNQDRQRIMENLTHFAAMRVALSNHRFEGAERDAQALMHSYDLYHDTSTNMALAASSESRYFPIDTSVCMPQGKQDQDRSFIQLYGSAGQTYYQDSFILDRRYGFSLLPPRKQEPDYFTRRRMDLKNFPQHPTHDNLYWSKPEYIPGNGWSVSVAAADSNSVLAGLAVKLNDLLSYGHPLLGTDINLWLDQHNHLLPFSSVPPNLNLQTLLDNVQLKDGWQQIPGYLVLRTALRGPGWQQVSLYPLQGVFYRSLNIISGQLLFALATLALLAITLGWLLHRHLARPLWDFVEIINKTGPHSLTARLPENRQDELGKIAHAYNLLLETLYVQYDTLENKVTERTRALNEAKQQAEQANKRKSAHLTTISHELRTPLSGALGAIELLHASKLSGEQMGLVDTAHQCTLSLLTIINNVLDFSRIESGQFSLHIEETPLLPLLDQAMQTIQGPAQKKGLALRTFVGQFVPLHLEVDAIRLRQILVNLLGNALKFTEIGGICLTVKRCGEQLIFAVSDSGQGISQEDQTKVFTPFFQAKGHDQGTGLGLTIAMNLAEMMGGKLELNSTFGLGSSLSFLLPLRKYRDLQPLQGELLAPLPLHRQLSAWGVTCEQDQQDSPLSAEELRFLPGKLYDRARQLLSGDRVESHGDIPIQPWRLQILLVDDAVINRDIIGMMLANLGQEVITVTSGAEALMQGRQQRFDLVLMDIRMPEMDGIECTRRWRGDRLNQDRSCMVMALSANTASDEIARCKDAGMHHYLTKPVTMALLANSISIAAEYQLQRNIELREQDLLLGTALLATEDEQMRQKIRVSLDALFIEIENNLQDGRKTSELLHTLKGCLGQAGFGELLCSVVDIENRVRHGLDLTQEEITELHQSLNSLFGRQSSLFAEHFLSRGNGI